MEKKALEMAENGGFNLIQDGDFTYIDDVVRAVEELIGRPPVGDTPARILNVGRGEPVSLLRMIELLEENLGQQAQKELLPMQPGDVPDTYADVESLVKDTGYRPSIGIEHGVGEFVKWYREYYNI